MCENLLLIKADVGVCVVAWQNVDLSYQFITTTSSAVLIFFCTVDRKHENLLDIVI